MKVGRPTKYDPAYCDQVIDFCMAGKSLTAFAGSIRVARSSLNEWASVHPDFSEALNIAKACACNAWEDRNLRVGDEGKGNPALVIFALKNFGADDWREKQPDEDAGKDKSFTFRWQA